MDYRVRGSKTEYNIEVDISTDELVNLIRDKVTRHLGLNGDEYVAGEKIFTEAYHGSDYSVREATQKEKEVDKAFRLIEKILRKKT